MSRPWLLAAALLAAANAGCGYLGHRARDFADIFRLEASVGVGLQAGITATEILHAGLGSSRRYEGGWLYGSPSAERRVEDYLPLSYLLTLADPDTECLHSLRRGWEEQAPRHRCYLLFPDAINRSGSTRSTLHFFDLEVGVFAGVVGLQAGFSFGELLDFILGLATIDIGDDDGRLRRETRSLWRPIPDSRAAALQEK